MTALPPEPTKLAYTIKEAAAACGVSEPIIRRAITAGDIAPVYPTSRPVILRAELEGWLQTRPGERGGS